MKPVILTHDYPFPPERVWALATDYDALKEVMDGLVTFEGVPEGRTVTGQKMDVTTSLFGRLPPQPYYMEVVECDDDAMVLRSSERGMGVRSWQHTVTVEPTAEGSRLTDRIEIDAGWRTPIFRAWARFMYGRRHAPRMRMLSAGWGD
ncbi:SRPBCC family protein [Maritimibacter dapengensis]|uniref:SRPBCC family protein n=1 Tax=Maritimibacter dapengensis TaxID=2836868 RepID=A0ABS6T4M7_9RHOB|nr:SRPBCC family protein [Maritimibacter dapengensis]MBV7380199.1 SRPBCC family protein [Maritimibacter dapengensis]